MWNSVDASSKMSRDSFSSPLSRRQVLKNMGNGFGAWMLASMLDEQSVSAAPMDGLHFPAKAKRVIFLFMHGGPSHVDTFDYKPMLAKDDGKPLPFEKPRINLHRREIC